MKVHWCHAAEGRVSAFYFEIFGFRLRVLTLPFETDKEAVYAGFFSTPAKVTEQTQKKLRFGVKNLRLWTNWAQNAQKTQNLLNKKFKITQKLRKKLALPENSFAADYQKGVKKKPGLCRLCQLTYQCSDFTAAVIVPYCLLHRFRSQLQAGHLRQDDGVQVCQDSQQNGRPVQHTVLGPSWPADSAFEGKVWQAGPTGTSS